MSLPTPASTHQTLRVASGRASLLQLGYCSTRTSSRTFALLGSRRLHRVVFPAFHHNSGGYPPLGALSRSDISAERDAKGWEETGKVFFPVLSLVDALGSDLVQGIDPRRLRQVAGN